MWIYHVYFTFFLYINKMSLSLLMTKTQLDNLDNGFIEDLVFDIVKNLSSNLGGNKK